MLFRSRYEQLTVEPERVGSELAAYLGASERPLVEALRRAHASSVGRYQTNLSFEELADVEEEAGALLAELGYLT